MKKKYWLFFLTTGLLVFFTRPSFALAEETKIKVVHVEEIGETYWVETSPLFDGLKKPAVAVALGGGGARALVNVGVLKALEEEKIPVHMVVGTSMGAVVAILYGSGLPVATIEEIALSGVIPSLIDFNPPFYRSLLSSAKLDTFIETVVPAENLENFWLPTAVLSLDLTNDVKYIHTTGRISRALHNAYSIPFLFPVHEDNEANRIDAGMFELTPALAARVLGADLVISTTAYDALPFDEYKFPVHALRKMLFLLTENNAKRIVGKYSDIVIEHEVGDYSFNDFHLAKQFIDMGYRRTKEMIPWIKEKLAEKEIGPAEEDGREAADVTAVLHDYKYNRVVGNKTVRPVFYYGKDHTLLHRRYFQADLMKWQYGLLLDTGRIELLFYNAGEKDGPLEIMGRVKKWRPAWDLICLAAVGGESLDYEVSLRRYFDRHQLGFGAARFSGVDFFHLQKDYCYNGEKFRTDGDFHLFVALEKPEASEYCFSNELYVPLRGPWSGVAKMVLSETNVTPAPQIYRGAEPAGQPAFQGSLELLYEWRFPFSKEVFQIIQWTGMDIFSFLDWQKAGEVAYSLGYGARADMKIIGIKPLSLGGYLSRDFAENTHQAAVKVDIAI